MGIGRCIAEGAGYGIDEEEALYLLRRDVERVTGACKLAFDFWDEMSGNIQATMVELTFQMGLSGYRKFRKHHYALGRGDFATAAKELLNSKFARQTPARAPREAARIPDGSGEIMGRIPIGRCRPGLPGGRTGLADAS